MVIYMKKISAIIACIVVAMTAASFSACSNSSFDSNKTISVVSREEGSGTRGAFIELFGIEVKQDDGSKKDMTYEEAIVADKTNLMMTNISNDRYAIGYISLGSLNEKVKALNIDGVAASAEGVKDSSYKVSRPFNIVTKGEAEGIALEFINYILSKDGQEVIESNGYISINSSAPSFSGSNPSGKIIISGSSSVSPVMEKLTEAYKAVNTNVIIEIQTTDSTTGISDASSGLCNIGMASRELKDSEKEGLNNITIALDGIAVIVNNDNPVSNLTNSQVKDIFTGEKTKWSEINE